MGTSGRADLRTRLRRPPTRVTTDEERWTQAEEILRGSPGPDARRRIRQQKIFFWSLMGGVLALGLLLGLLAVLLAGDHPQHHAERSLWQTIAGVALAAAGLVVIVLAFVVLKRSGQLGNRWHAPTSALSRSQRRALARQVLGKEPVDPARLPLARDLAERLVLTYRYLLLVFLGMVLIWTSQLLFAPTGWHLWLQLATIAVWLVALFVGRRQSRRLQRFLADRQPDGRDA